MARDMLPGAGGVRPTVICAPLTAMTRPSVSRVARAGVAGAAGGVESVISTLSVAAKGRHQAARRRMFTYAMSLEFPLRRASHLAINRSFTMTSGSRNVSRRRSGCAVRCVRSGAAAPEP